MSPLTVFTLALFLFNNVIAEENEFGEGRPTTVSRDRSDNTRSDIASILIQYADAGDYQASVINAVCL